MIVVPHVCTSPVCAHAPAVCLIQKSIRQLIADNRKSFSANEDIQICQTAKL